MEPFDWKMIIKPNILKLKLVGLWPSGDAYQPNLYTLWSTLSIFLFIYAHTFFQAVNIIFIFDDLQAITATIFVTLSELLTMLKTYCMIRNMKLLKQLMSTLSSQTFQPKNERQRKLIEPSLKFWKVNYSVFWVFASGCIFFWAAFPILDNSVKERRLPFLAWYPYNTKISPWYEITYIYQIIGISFVAATTLSIDNLIAALNVYIGAQFDILRDDLNHLFDRKDGRKVDFITRIVNCVKHHRLILRFAFNSNQFFNWIVFLQFFISATSIGITMFQLTVVTPFSSEFFSLLTFGLAITVEIFIYCWFGNEVEIKSNQISYASFESYWTGVPLEIKKLLVFLTMRTQKPLKISALNLFYLSLDTFMKILRTAWSYFALLQQVSSREK